MDRIGAEIQSEKMGTPNERVIVAVATPLQPELAQRIAAVDGRVEVRYEPDLLPPARFPATIAGPKNFRRLTEQEARWRRLLRGAEVVFGLPGDSAQGLAGLIRAHAALRWVQATSGDAAEQVRTAGLTGPELDRVLITGVAGV